MNVRRERVALKAVSRAGARASPSFSVPSTSLLKENIASTYLAEADRAESTEGTQEGSQRAVRGQSDGSQMTLRGHSRHRTHLVMPDLSDEERWRVAEKLCMSVILSRRCALERSTAAMAPTMEPSSHAKKTAPVTTTTAEKIISGTVLGVIHGTLTSAVNDQ